MARKRTIDPDIWSDEKVLELPWAAVPFYVGLISFADDEGRLTWSPRQLQARITAGRDDVSLTDVSGWMDAIVTAGLVVVYEVDGKHFAYHPAWESHQYVNRPAPSHIPPPESRTPHTHVREIPAVGAKSSHPTKGLQRDAHVPLESVSESVLESVSDMECTPDLSVYLENYITSNNRSGKITKSRVGTLIAELREMWQGEFAGERWAFMAGLRAANAAGAANKTYVAKCARSALAKGQAVPVPGRYDQNTDPNFNPHAGIDMDAQPPELTGRAAEVVARLREQHLGAA